jgi:hypothetical protein
MKSRAAQLAEFMPNDSVQCIGVSYNSPKYVLMLSSSSKKAANLTKKNFKKCEECRLLGQHAVWLS